jgi:DNA ligase-associated metallophosphoesterase
VGLADAEVLCMPAGALWLQSEGALIVADLHLEKGSAFAARGQLLPPYDTGETLSRLEVEVDVLAPRLIVLLGDTFHDGGAEDRLCSRDAARVTALGQGRTLIWILGNHDPDGPRGIPGERLAALSLGGLSFIHQPAVVARSGEIAGHLHPCAKVAGVGGSVRRRCFVTDGRRMILPAFGAYAGGLNVRDVAIRGLLGASKLAAVLGRDRVHPVPWRALRGD